jgi:hypothetical protein
MTKMFKENGFLSEEGNKVLHSFHYALNETMFCKEVQAMSAQELQVLQANLASLIGNAFSNAIRDRNTNEK